VGSTSRQILHEEYYILECKGVQSLEPALLFNVADEVNSWCNFARPNGVITRKIVLLTASSVTTMCSTQILHLHWNNIKSIIQGTIIRLLSTTVICLHFFGDYEIRQFSDFPFVLHYAHILRRSALLTCARFQIVFCSSSRWNCNLLPNFKPSYLKICAQVHSTPQYSGNEVYFLCYTDVKFDLTHKDITWTQDRGVKLTLTSI
jgi:hypothetical protein